MNTILWLQLTSLLFDANNNLNTIKHEQEYAIQCLRQKECTEVWDSQIQEWVIVRKPKVEIEPTGKSNETGCLNNNTDKTITSEGKE